MQYRYDARWISETKSQNTRKRRNGGIINLLFDGYWGEEKYEQCAKCPLALYVKPSNKVYILYEYTTSFLFGSANFAANNILTKIIKSISNNKASQQQIHSKIHRER